MRVFLTGATGFLGAHLLAALRRQGHEIVALTRGPQAPRPGVQWVEGSLEESGWHSALSGCSHLINAAASYASALDGSASEDTLEQINVQAPVAVYRAALEAGLERFVQISSAGVLPPEGGPEGSAAASDLAPYFASKARAESALQAAEDPRLPLLLLRPSMLLGPGDRGPSPAGEWLLGYLRGQHPVVPPANLVVADVRDVAEACARSLTIEPPAPCYHLSGHHLRFAALCDHLEATTGIPAPAKRPPYWLAWTLLSLRGLTGSQPLSAADLRRMHRLTLPDTTRARSELAWCPRPWTESVDDAIQGLREHHGETRH
ncbi:MAG: NAD-dependent epimerase/dehydratase family protein [Myxococcota bacterium]|nr:NAD-dependent epimerase/dehydratase family protein [Myxococcota bacterium]